MSGLSAFRTLQDRDPHLRSREKARAGADPLDPSLARPLENQRRKAGTLAVRLPGQVWGWAGGTGEGFCHSCSERIREGPLFFGPSPLEGQRGGRVSCRDSQASPTRRKMKFRQGPLEQLK